MLGAVGLSLCAGIALGLRGARAALVVLFLVDATSAIALLASGRAIFPAGTALGLAFLAAGLALSWLPASRRWFTARAASNRLRPWYSFGIGFAVACVLPLWLLAFGSKVLVLGMALGSAGGAIAWMGAGLPTAFALVPFMWLASQVSRPQLWTVGTQTPPDVVGWILVAVVHVLAALAIAFAGARSRRRSVYGPRAYTGVPVFAMLASLATAALLVVMAPPILRAVRAPLAAAKAVADLHLQPQVPLAGYPELEGRFDIRDDSDERYRVESSGRWRVAEGKLVVIAESTRLIALDSFPPPRDISLKRWRYVLRGTRGEAQLSMQGREGFEYRAPAEASGEHRLVAPIVQDVDAAADETAPRRVRLVAPAILAGHWLEIELEFADLAKTRARAVEPYAFAHALAAKGLAPHPCTARSTIAEAVERGCHEALTALLKDPEALKQLSPMRLRQGDRLRSIAESAPMLSIALQRNDVVAARILMEAGAALPDGSGNSGYKVIHEAVFRGSPEMVRQLANDRRAMDGIHERSGRDYGKTALMFAAERGRAEIVEVLLAAGADRATRTPDGRTAHDLAVAAGHLELARSLLVEPRAPQ